MFEQRDRNRDLFAVVLAVVAVLLTLSLLTYHHDDPLPTGSSTLARFYQPDVIIFPTKPKPENLCGRLGAVLSDGMYELFGIGAWYVLIVLWIVTVRMLMRRPLSAPAVRAAGWVASLVGLTTMAHLCVSWWTPGPTVGPGGLLGATVGSLLCSQLAPVGTFLVALCLAAVGILLSTDYLLLQLAATATMQASQRTTLLVGRRGARAAAEATSEGEVGQASAVAAAATPAGGLAVRIRGRRALSMTDDDLDEDWEDDETAAASSELADDAEESEEDDEDAEEEGDEEEGEFDEESEDDEFDDESAELASGIGAASKLVAGAAAGSGSTAGDDAGHDLKVRKGMKKDERKEVIEQLEQASRKEEVREYKLPPIDLLRESDEFSYDEQEKEVRRKAKVLEKTFRDFGFNVKVVEIETGPVIAQYEVELEAGLRLSKITGLADDLAIALRVPSVRIVAPIPGKNTVGIEVPNQDRQVVRLREVMEESTARVKKMRIPLFLGKDVSGNALVVDLSTLPHLLIAGRTGTGKSVCLNAIITSILMTRTPDEVRMLMIDPKMVELSGYQTLPHLMHPVVTDMRKAEAILAWAVDKMEERYSLLARAKVRHIASYNQLSEEELLERLEIEGDHDRSSVPLNLPYIVIVADEMADLMMTSGKEVEQHIIRLAQKSRAVGIHLILATQKPTVDVITGLIKSNLPARIAFQVASRTDSRVVLDEMGADKLLGNGDMLFLWPGTSTLLRGQGTYLSDDEINAVVDCVSTGEQDFVTELVQMKTPSGEQPGVNELKNRDELYESAIEVVIREGRGSVSLLQRALGIGYGRAARLIDFMAEDGIVGPYNGSQAREVVISMADWHAMQGLPPEEGSAAPTGGPPAASAKSRTNKIRPEDAAAGRRESSAAAESAGPKGTKKPAISPSTVASGNPSDAFAKFDTEEYDGESFAEGEFDEKATADDDGEFDEYETDDYESEEYADDEYEYEEEEEEGEEEEAEEDESYEDDSYDEKAESA
ncbi:MAG: DNA translocase FtsK 4TM domain-containing protein [Pirellulales bacterium]